jgi:hypothetical protein
MPKVTEVFFSVVHPDTSRSKLKQAWVYWREGEAISVLRVDRQGFVFRYKSGDAARPRSYVQPFVAPIGATVQLAYSVGRRPVPSEARSQALRFTARVVRVSIAAEHNPNTRRTVDATGRVTTLRVLPLSELRLPEIAPYPLSVAVATAAAPRPRARGARAISFLMHRFGLQNYIADWAGADGRPGEHRSHGNIAVTATRADLVTVTEALCDWLGWQSSPLRRIYWAVGHASAGASGSEASFDMTANANGTPNRVFATDLVSVLQVLEWREHDPEALANARVPAKIFELERELLTVRKKLEENRISELVLYGCRIGSSEDGNMMLWRLSRILSSPRVDAAPGVKPSPGHTVRVGGYQSWVVARQTAREGSDVEVGLVSAPADELLPRNWSGRNSHSLIEPEVWRVWEG